MSEAILNFNNAKKEWENLTPNVQTPAYFAAFFGTQKDGGCFVNAAEIAECYSEIEALAKEQKHWTEQEQADALKSFTPIKEEIDAKNAAALETRNIELYEIGYYSDSGDFDRERDTGIEPIPTGFSQVDAILEGGLIDALYVFGGTTSVGKTDFLLQMADQMAKAENAKETPEHDFLYFSLEMRRKELFARSVSRYSLAKSIELYSCNNFAVLQGNILIRPEEATFMADPQYAEKHLEVLNAARQSYVDGIRGRLYVHAGKHYNVDEIRKEIQEHQDGIRNKRAPVIFVDHMQILRPHRDYITDKQNIDYIVTELKQISNDFRAPVIAVSILNRGNYGRTGGNTKQTTDQEKPEMLSLAAFKESGLIEYSADGAWGMIEKGDNGNTGVSLRRDIELQFLKNRQGGKDGRVSFSYQPAFHTFIEQREAEN